ncbi:MAG: hypothetical protein IJ418_02050 [Clostridia bacterium]|nr:hypothetical protein [Clostridia bacterium]
MSTDAESTRLACPVCHRAVMLESTYHFSLEMYKVIVECGNQYCRMYRKPCSGMGKRFDKAKEAAGAEMKRRVAEKKGVKTCLW